MSQTRGDVHTDAAVAGAVVRVDVGVGGVARRPVAAADVEDGTDDLAGESVGAVVGATHRSPMPKAAESGCVDCPAAWGRAVAAVAVLQARPLGAVEHLGAVLPR